MNNFGDNVRARRILLGLTQQQLAERIGVKSRSVINKIENEDRNITQKMIERLASALFTTPGHLLENTNTNTILYHNNNSLSQDEKRVLDLYNSLDDVQQKAIITMMESMVK